MPMPSDDKGSDIGGLEPAFSVFGFHFSAEISIVAPGDGGPCPGERAEPGWRRLFRQFGKAASR
ncbi:MAG: hypothetical protein WDN08_14265 [Rhizomicrobium sp.]